MKKYLKIQSLFLRNPETNFKTFLSEYSLPEFEYLKDIRWEWTEKIDGTNTRVYFDGEKVLFGGKGDNSSIPTFLLRKLEQIFTPEKMKDFKDLTLFGEGYGNKIQKAGKDYIADDVDFILFDVQTPDGLWLERINVDDIAAKLNIKYAPIVRYGTLDEAVEYVKKGFKSEIADCQAEGLVMRPKYELTTRKGERIITKLKFKDFN